MARPEDRNAHSLGYETVENPSVTENLLAGRLNHTTPVP